jgi:DNA-binding HxlR family transcriptional regulator
MASVLNKLKQTQENPEDAIKMDAEIRESKRSISARLLVNKVNELHDKGASKEEIEAALTAEKAEYPKLFAMVLDPGYSRAMLSAMLNQLEAVERGRKTTH